MTLHHATHSHPFLQFSDVRAGTFTIPAVNEIDPDIFYRVRLTVTDSTGLSHTVERDIKPVKSEVTLASNVRGAHVWLENRLLTAPYTFTSVAGIVREIRAEPQQRIKGVTYLFSGWSDGITQTTRQLSTPASNATITAIYRKLPAAGTKGLVATYYNNRDFSGTRVERIDPNIDFDWKLGSPDKNIARDTFSARWTGKLQISKAGTYTFRIETDGGVRLRIGDTWIVRQLGAAGGSFTVKINLGAGKHALQMEYRHNKAAAKLRLSWSGPGITKREVIPRERLFATA